LKGECNVELLLQHNNKKLITHVNRLKPYFVQSPAAVPSPDFFPAKRAATPPPAPQQQKDKFEKFFPYENDQLLDSAVNYSDPSPPTNALPRQRSHHCRTASSSSYGDMPEVSGTDPSPAFAPTFAQIATRPHRRLSLSSSSSSLLLSPGDNIASRTRSCSHLQTPERPKIFMPQISFNSLPVLK
jgi:hypothetical protein